MHKSIKTVVVKLFAISFFTSALYTTASAQKDSTLKMSMPAAGKVHDGKPAGKGWVNLLDTALWDAEVQYWQLNNGIFHGESKE
jgi:hypothetical protein